MDMHLVLPAFVLLVLALLFLTERDAHPQRLKDRTVLWIAAGMVISLITAVTQYLLTKPQWNWLASFGTIIFLLGLTVRVIARSTLGKFFTYEVKVHDGHQLITTGIYSYVRHPLYTAILLLWFGTVLLFQSRAGFALVLLILVPALWHRMNVEEALLTRTFGKQYQHYLTTTKRLVPFLY